jgi:predicted nucleic acid-binding protein
VILVDSPVWIDHFRRRDPELENLLGRRLVMMHGFVMGELALGHLPARKQTLQDMLDLPAIIVADDIEVLALIDTGGLFGIGIGYVDANLLASLKLMPDVQFWTRDRRLGEAAARLNIPLYK